MVTAPLRPKLFGDLTDLRSLVIILLFGLVAMVLWLISHNKALLDDAAFMAVVGNLVGNGGLGLMLAWLFGGTKTGGETMTALANNATQGQSAPLEEKL